MTNSPIQIRALRNGNSADALVREVAQRSVASTRKRLHLDTDQLGVDELRGYVRARAIAPVRRLAQELAREHRISALLADQLVDRALERTVHAVLREISRPIVATPPAYLPLRAAA